MDEAERTHQRAEVTKNGRRAAVLMSADDYDSLMETLDILGDAEAMAEIRQETLTSLLVGSRPWKRSKPRCAPWGRLVE